MHKSKGINTSKYLPSALSSHITSPRTENDIQIKNDIAGYNKFVQFLSTQNVSLLRRKLLEFRGTHNPIAYKPQFNFQQRWQKINKITEEVNLNILMSSNMYCYVFSFIIMIYNCILIWFLSVFRLYSISNSKPFFEIGIAFIIGDVFLKIYVYTEHYKANNQTLKIQKIFSSFDFLALVVGDLWCVIYYICIITDTSLGNVELNQMLPFDLITLFLLIRRAFEIYNYLVILIVATKYKNQMTIFDLAVKMICILHFFSIILYGVALTSPDQNWMTRISVNEASWDTKYIYTLYFACTTMFTVGYGDILPTNKTEMITIMFIEALGMALFGYIVNEVGIALGNMRKKRSNLQRDIFNSQRISKLYELSNDLGKKVRDYVISNQIAQEELGIRQQNDFLLKLNEELRQEVKQSHQLKIIKTSLFFITYWSKKIQIQMAKKLQKCIFAPNQNIHSKGEIDHLFVMVKGKIQVFTEKKFGTKTSCRKLLKVIQKGPGQQVFNNVFGLTNFFSGKVNRLKAVAKESTVCYTLGYQDIRDSINEDSNDFEYFHYLRQRFQFAKIPQKWQTPNIVNIRQNYSPVIYYIIKKYTKMCKKQNRHKSWTRKDYQNKRICELNFGRNQTSQPIDPESYQNFSSESDKSYVSQNPSCINMNTFMDMEIQRSDQILSQTPMLQKSNACIQQINNSNQIISNRSYRRKYWYTQRQQRYEQKAKQFIEENVTLTSQFEIGKNYNRFFPKGNKKITIDKLIKKPELLLKDCVSPGKQTIKTYQATLKKTIKRNFSEMFKDEIFDP